MVQLERYLELDLESFLKHPRDPQVSMVHTQFKGVSDIVMPYWLPY